MHIEGALAGTIFFDELFYNFYRGRVYSEVENLERMVELRLLGLEKLNSNKVNVIAELFERARVHNGVRGTFDYTIEADITQVMESADITDKERRVCTSLLRYINARNLAWKDLIKTEYILDNVADRIEASKSANSDFLGEGNNPACEWVAEVMFLLQGDLLNLKDLASHALVNRDKRMANMLISWSNYYVEILTQYFHKLRAIRDYISTAKGHIPSPPNHTWEGLNLLEKKNTLL